MVHQVITYFLIVAAATSFVIQPRDLVDEAVKQLAELQTIVRGAILAAQSEIDNYQTDFVLFARNENQNGIVSLQLEQTTVNQQVEEIKELGKNSQTDISACTNIREDVLRLTEEHYIQNLTDCIVDIGTTAMIVINSTRYRIDVTTYKLHQLQEQMDRCNGDLVCISPLLTQIQLDKVRLPQNIKTEALAAENILNKLKISVEDCSVDNVSAYVTSASYIIDDIINCANSLINQNGQ